MTKNKLMLTSFIHMKCSTSKIKVQVKFEFECIRMHTNDKKKKFDEQTHNNDLVAKKNKNSGRRKKLP